MGYAMVAAAGLQALGSIMQGNAAAGAANFNAKVAEQNATIATQKAEWSGAMGEQKVGIAGLQAKQTLGNIKVAQSANNVDVNSGSALAVQQSQRQAAQLNLANIRSNAARQAFGYETEAVGFKNQATLSRSQAKNAKMAGYIGALTHVAEGAAGAYSAFGGGGGFSNPGGTPLMAESGGGGQSFLGTAPSSSYPDWSYNNGLFSVNGE